MTLVNFNQRPAKRYDSFFNEFFNAAPPSWANPSRDISSLPAANVQETPQAYHIDLNVPGRNKEDFNVKIEKDLLTISFEKKDESKTEGVTAIRREFSFNSFKRSFSLDETINTDGIEAKYENGILKIALPKKEDVKKEPKQIAIN